MESVEEKFINELRKSRHVELFKFYNLFSILWLGEKNFMTKIIDLYKEYPNDWFAFYHKTFRQCDVFSDNLSFVKSTITDEELKELNQILLKRSKIRRELSDNDALTDDTYNSLGVRLKELNIKRRQLEVVNTISGHLDSLMHIAINEDNKLYDFMDEFIKKHLKEN